MTARPLGFPHRRRLAAVLLMAVLLSVAGWVPGRRGEAVPQTVARRVPVDAGTVAGGTGSTAAPVAGLALSGDGTIRARAEVRTPESVVCGDIWSTGVGLTWEQPAGHDVDVTVRWGGDAGRLGSPVETEVMGDHAPDPGTPEADRGRRTTSFLWTGGSRCMGFSLLLPPGTAIRGVEAVFLNTSGTADGPGSADSGFLGAVGGFLGSALGTAPAEAMTVQPAMVPRWKWGADESLRNCDPYYAPAVKMGFVHHTAGTNDYDASRSDDILRGILYFHTQIQGWCDIAYNFLIDRFGTVFIGRRGGAARPTVPGATQGFNTGSFAVAAMGNYSETSVPAATLSSLKKLLAWRLDVAHLPPKGWATMISGGGDHNRYPAGTAVTLNVISGHRRTGYTNCPGDDLWNRLPAIRTDVVAMGLPKLYRPKVSPGSFLPAEGSITVTATGSGGSLTWRVEILAPDGSIFRALRRKAVDLSLTWAGRGQGTWAPPGEYSVVIRATAPSGATALSATLPLTIEAPPEPSPTPTPTPTETGGG
ncbi:MAG: N-acetylmuramoyl-L-alanine amidase [Actinobacteria bacterium]|nr:N-acetylmuramoyl-L-alanine amidase [Actinomycetota bacterium]